MEQNSSSLWIWVLSAGVIAGAIIFLVLAYYAVAPVLLKILQPLFGKVPSLFASRYLFSKKKWNAINRITLISITGTMIVTAALITVLSVFNGFQVLIENRYGTFDPDIKIQPKTGRTFAHSDAFMNKAKEIKGVEYVCPVIENKAIITYGDKQQLVTVKGLPPDYQKVERLDKLVYKGAYSFKSDNGEPLTILGGTVAFYLSASYKDRENKSTIWAALDSSDPVKDKEKAVDSAEVFVSGYFSSEMEYDGNFILVDFNLAQELFHYNGLITGYDVKIKPGYASAEVKKDLAQVYGNDFMVKDSYDLHKSLFEVMNTEKWVAYLLLTLMLVITGVNIIGSLSMIIVEKTRDIAILKSMGAGNGTIKKIFLMEGVLVGTMGGIAGMAGAFLLGIIHETWGLIPLNGGQSFGDIEFFPHQMNVWDFLVIFGTVFIFSLVASLYPSSKAAKITIVAGLRK